jgi:hypothetical protein
MNRRATLEPSDAALDHVGGPDSAPMILEYGDYECPYSRRGAHRADEGEPAGYERSDPFRDGFYRRDPPERPSSHRLTVASDLIRSHRP